MIEYKKYYQSHITLRWLVLTSTSRENLSILPKTDLILQFTIDRILVCFVFPLTDRTTGKLDSSNEMPFMGSVKDHVSYRSY